MLVRSTRVMEKGQFTQKSLPFVCMHCHTEIRINERGKEVTKSTKFELTPFETLPVNTSVNCSSKINRYFLLLLLRRVCISNIYVPHVICHVKNGVAERPRIRTFFFRSLRISGLRGRQQKRKLSSPSSVSSDIVRFPNERKPKSCQD